MNQNDAPIDDKLHLVGDDGEGDEPLDGANHGAVHSHPRSVLTNEMRGELALLCAGPTWREPSERLGARSTSEPANAGQRGYLKFDEPMRRHTTLKIGGMADAFISPPSAEALQQLLQWCGQHQLAPTVVGGGSNLLVRDGGIRGVVVASKGMRSIDVAGHVLTVAAGVSTGKVLSVAIEHSLGGIEFLGGVPGSIGGGLIMNAGTYMGEFEDVTTQVTSVRLSDGEIVQRDNASCGFAYRHSALPPSEIVVGATLALTPRAKADIEADVKGLRQRRHEREPKKVSSNGSTFKNPPGDFAGRLIELAGCKGWNEGDAQCSPVHANWLVNNGVATASELLRLIDRVRDRVLAFHGIELQLEVKILGEEL